MFLDSDSVLLKWSTPKLVWLDLSVPFWKNTVGKVFLKNKLIGREVVGNEKGKAP